MPLPQNMDPAHLDMMAKQIGFPDYKTWAAWNAQRSQGNRSIGNVTSTGQATVNSAPPADPQQKPGNWFQHLMSNVWPSFSLIDKVGSAYGNATGQ